MLGVWFWVLLKPLVGVFAAVFKKKKANGVLLRVEMAVIPDRKRSGVNDGWSLLQQLLRISCWCVCRSRGVLG